MFKTLYMLYTGRWYSWREKEKEIVLLENRYKLRMVLFDEMEAKVTKLEKENQRMREIIVCVSDKHLKGC